MESKTNFYKLCLMMFMQYFLFAVWWVPFAAYLSNALNLEVFEVSLILCSMAIGSMASSFIGLIADRRFSSEKVLAFLNLLTAIFLLIAAQQTTFVGLLISVILVMLCYMPTWSLTSSIAMTYISAEQFPRMRLIGTIGWVASGLFSLVAIHVFHIEIFDGSVYPLYCGVATGLLAALFNLFLPHTPPNKDNKSKISIQDILGLRVISRLKNKEFNRFIFVSFLAIIPFTLYHVYGSMFFADEQVRNITVTMNWGQVAEMLFLFLTTTILLKIGFKKTMILGLVAMLVRYASFYLGAEFGQQWLYSIGILTHGLIFGLFFVVGQVYTDKIAQKELRAQAQGFLSFIIWGVGFLIGTLCNGAMIDGFRQGEKCDWAMLFAIAAVFTIVIIFLFLFVFKNPVAEKKEPELKR